MPLNPTDEQLALIDAAGNSEPILSNAYAGTAKTTTLCMLAPQIRVPTLSTTFNKKNAENLRGKLPQNYHVRTLDSLGLQAWARSLPGHVRLEKDDRKLSKLINAVSKDHHVSLSKLQWEQVRELVGKAMLCGLTPNNEGCPLTPDSSETWHELALGALMLDDDQELLVDLARVVLAESIALARRGVYSFPDLAYCPTVLGGKWPRFPAAIVDEFQDLSLLNFRQLELATRPDAKLVIVGDIRQSIYAFRGAAGNALELAQKLRSKWQTLDLTISFRCPKKIVQRQQGHAPGFRAWDANAEGRVDYATTTAKGQWSWTTIQALRGQIGGDIAVLCRNNAPLLRLGFALIRRSIPPIMLGRDIASGLRALAGKIIPVSASGMTMLLGLVQEWEQTESSKAEFLEAQELLTSINDKAESLRAVIFGAECQDRNQINRALGLLFDTTNSPVTLSTIHRAKGLEWNTVVHLDPWRCRPRAKQSEIEQMQELNARYVCETRTRELLIEADMERFGP